MSSARTLKLPALTPAASQLVVHVAVVFLMAFGAQLVAAATGAIHDWPTLLAVVTAAAAAGVTAVAHFLLGLIPTPTPVATSMKRPRMVQTAVGTGDLVSAAMQVLISFAVVFLTTFGAQLAVAGSGVASISTLTALIVSAAAAAASAAFHAALRLIPVPLPAPAGGSK